MTVMGLTLSKKSLIPGWERSSIRKLIVGIGQSGRGGVGGGGGMGKAERDHLIEWRMATKSCDTIHNADERLVRWGEMREFSATIRIY